MQNISSLVWHVSPKMTKLEYFPVVRILLSLPRAQVQSLFEELRSCEPWGVIKKKKKKRQKWQIKISRWAKTAAQSHGSFTVDLKKMSLFQFLQGWSFQSVVHWFLVLSEMAQEVCEVKTFFLSNNKILFALFTMLILVQMVQNTK